MFLKHNDSNKRKGHIAKANAIDIWYETFGNKGDKPLLLIMGGCCQGVLWHRSFCEQLVREGFFVIRFDHRDSGLSTSFDFELQPYNLMDMAKDIIGLLDFIGVEKVYIFGVSLGGFIAEIMAGYFSQRVYSILLLGSTCEIRPMNLAYAGKSLDENVTLSSPKQNYLDWMFQFMEIVPQSHEKKLAQRMEGWNQLSGSTFPLDAKINREMQEEFLTRVRYEQGILNHIKMLNTHHSEELIRVAPSKVQTPTVILHGSEDPIFPKDHGYALSQIIKNSTYLLVDGMGHIPSDPFYDLYIKILKQQSLL
ncbi:3-oxoadipate enol-lactonase 2 [Candidatus Rubidus massiliensis]|nr:3-oxoadipate enol-lactonase 2 [Candidatus Rubidus massiliensis]